MAVVLRVLLPLVAITWGRSFAVAQDVSNSSLDNISLANVSLAGARPLSALQAWLGGLVVSIPAGKGGTLPMDLGTLTLTGGSCTNLRVGKMESQDESTGQVLRFGVQVSDFELACHIEGVNDGDLQIDLVMGRSSIDIAVQIDPTTSLMAPEFPLPLGQMNLTACTADLVVQDITFNGTSPIVSMIANFGMPKEVLANLIGGFINVPLCDGLRNLVNTNGTASGQQGANLAGIMLMDPFPLAEPVPIKPLLSWDKYPPMLVLEAMLRERFHLWTDRALQILDVSTFESTLVKSENVSLKMYHFQVEGVGPKSHPGLVLDPSGPKIGAFVDMHDLVLRTSLGLEVTVPGQPVLEERIGFAVGLNNLSLGLRAFIDGQMLNSLEMDQAMERPACLYQCAAGTTTEASDAIAIEHMSVGMKPLLKITAPGSLETGITDLINTVVSSLYAGYLPTLNKLVNGGLAMARNPLNSLIWKKINAFPECSRAEMHMGVAEGAIRSFWCGSIAVCLVGLTLAAIAQCWSHGSATAQDVEVGDSLDVGVVVVASPSPQELCLASQPFVPRALSVFYPFAVVAVMLLFCYADSEIGATVGILTMAKGNSATVGPIFSFSLISTVVHSWKAGAYVISLIALITSGIWPFVKLSLLIVSWSAPPKRFSTKTRGGVINFLDTWGKYSFVDSWFLVMSMSAFSIDWEGVGNTSMRVQTVPTAAFYAYFCATCCAIVLGLVANEVHLKAAAIADTQTPQFSTNSAEGAVAKPLGSLHHSRRVRIGVCSAIGFSVVMAAVGIFAISFNFEIRGIAIEFLFGEAIDKQYSLFSVGSTLAQGRSIDLGLLGLEIVFLSLAVVVPLLQMAMLAMLWVAPLTIKRQRSLMHMCHVVDAWSSLDVAVVVLVICCFEFGTMAEFLVQKSGFAGGCDMVKDLTKEECLNVEMKAHPLMVVLCIAGVMFMVVPKLTLRLSADLLAKRTEQEARGKSTEGQDESSSSSEADLATRDSPESTDTSSNELIA